jgi:coenzyme F420-reducing hydrogenase gamma subunit
MRTGRRKPRLAVWKFASCDGCQLSVLECEPDLLGLADTLDIAFFPEVTSRPIRGRYDLSLVEGSISTPEDAERIRAVRRRSRQLVTLGACATAGGIQALRNFADIREFISAVYARPDYIHTLATSTPIAAHVPVDFELRGCPVNPPQLHEVLSALLAGRRPVVPPHSLCIECKSLGRTCVLVAGGEACLGPVTQAGCGAICPASHRGCYGCFGPQQTVNAAALSGALAALGLDRRSLLRLYRTFNAAAEPFRVESERHGE